MLRGPQNETRTGFSCLHHSYAQQASRALCLLDDGTLAQETLEEDSTKRKHNMDRLVAEINLISYMLGIGMLREIVFWYGIHTARAGHRCVMRVIIDFVQGMGGCRAFTSV